MAINSVDRISSLPEFILHDLLSILPIEEAARTSLLSKQWNCVWESFPISDFDQRKFIKIPWLITDPIPECAQKVDNFLNFVKISLMRSTYCERRGNDFNLRVTDVGPKTASKVNECLELALNGGAINVSVDLWPYRTTDCKPKTTIVPNPLIKYSYVKKLYLAGLSLSEKSIHDIVHNCPNIRSLDLMLLKRLRKLVIKTLDKLEEISIHTTKPMSVDIHATKLRTCTFISSGEDVPNFTVINLNSCRGLKRLRLESSAITDDLFHSLIVNFPLLEELRINSFKKLQRVTLSARHLKRFEALRCDNIEAIEIDSPVLSSFSYRAEILPRLILKKTPSDMEIDYVLRTRPIPIDTSRFVKLREFLATCTKVKYLNVTISSWEKPTFDREELRRFVIPPPRQLQHLRLEIGTETRSKNEATVLEGLLWSCHPKRITVSWDLGVIPQKKFQKVFYGRLTKNKRNNLSCCGSSNVKCWRHYLNRATVKRSFGGDEICFHLDWDDSIC